MMKVSGVICLRKGQERCRRGAGQGETGITDTDPAHPRERIVKGARMNATVLWSSGLSFTGTAGSDFEVALGADPSVGGQNDGFRPMELLGVSLAGCTAMDVISILRKKRQEVTAFGVKVLGEKAAEHPKVLTEAVIGYDVTGRGIDEAAVRRAIQLSAEKYCPVQAMLSKTVPIQLEYAIYEGESEESRTLVAEGRWEPE
jgi:putative redox protein